MMMMMMMMMEVLLMMMMLDDLTCSPDSKEPKCFDVCWTVHRSGT